MGHVQLAPGYVVLHNWLKRHASAMTALAVLLTCAAALPAQAQVTGDEPIGLQGPFTWTQQRGQFGAVIHGELKLRLLPGAGTFTCFLQGAGELQGQLKAGPSVTRIDGHVTMAAASCSGTINTATGALAGTAQLHVKTTGSTTVDVHMQGANQHHVEPINADSNDALILSGNVNNLTGTGKARYVKGGAFDWTVTRDGSAPTPPVVADPAPPKPTTPTPQSVTQKLGAALTQALGPAKAPGKQPPTQADLDKLAAQKQQLKADLDKALADEKAHKDFVNGLDESAAKGAVDGLKATLEHGAKVLDETLKKNKWDEHAPPGTASKSWSAIDKLMKIKEWFTDVKDVQKTFEDVNKEVKNGGYNATRGNMIKGTAVLGKTIKIVVDKVPIVGSAASEVVDKTFGVVIKLGSDRAKTGTRWDCCNADAMSDCCLD